MKITHDEMHEIWNGDDQVLDELIETTRWAVLHRLVFKKDGKFWECSFREPATEDQEWDDDDLDCTEVFDHEVTVIKYLTRAELIELEKKESPR